MLQMVRLYFVILANSKRTQIHEFEEIIYYVNSPRFYWLVKSRHI